MTSPNVERASEVAREATSIFAFSFTRLQEALITPQIDTVRGLQIAKDLSDAAFLAIRLLRSNKLLTPENGWTVSDTFSPVYTLDRIANTEIARPPEGFVQQMRMSTADDPNRQIISIDLEVLSPDRDRIVYCAGSTLPLRFYNLWRLGDDYIDEEDHPPELATWASTASTIPDDPIWAGEVNCHALKRTSVLFDSKGRKQDNLLTKQYVIDAATLTHLFVTSALQRYIEII